MSEVPIMVMPWHRPDPCKPLRMQTEAAFKSSYIDYLSSLSLDSPTLGTPLSGIMCTIGTSSKKVEMMVDLMQQGMSMALVPLALGVRQDHVETIANLRRANTAFSQIKNIVFPLAIAVQLKGPGLRIGGLDKNVSIELPLHHKITLTTDKAWRTRGTEHYLYIGFPEMCHVLGEGDLLLLGNGVVMLQVEVIEENEAVCAVVGSGVIHSFMSVSVPDVPIILPPLTDEDLDDLRMAANLGVDIVVATHTQNGHHIREVRQALEREEGSGIKLWAQIETKQAVDNLDEILGEVDAVLLSRISLTQDIPAEKLFLSQKIIVGRCNKAGIPVFVSSHFLPSMQADVTPSIAELTDVSTAILDGADGFVMRNTTAVGKHPDYAVKTLSGICLEAEAAVWHHQTFSYLNTHVPPPIDPTHAIAISAVEASLKTSAAAILLATTSGRSAQLVARYRPRCPIIAVSRYGQVARQLNTWRAVVPLHYVDPPLPDWSREVDVRLQFGIEHAKVQGIIRPGDPIVLLNGWRQGAGFTNTIRIVYASDSFPWVYPHQLPSTVPSDNTIMESDKLLHKGKTESTDKKTPTTLSQSSKPVSINNQQAVPRRPSLLTSSSNKLSMGSRIKSMEEKFQAVHMTRSKDIENHIPEQEIKSSTFDAVPVSNPSDGKKSKTDTVKSAPPKEPDHLEGYSIQKPEETELVVTDKTELMADSPPTPISNENV